jgi:hypothetical protein
MYPEIPRKTSATVNKEAKPAANREEAANREKTANRETAAVKCNRSEIRCSVSLSLHRIEGVQKNASEVSPFVLH